MFGQYSPFSWVVAGFAGLLTLALYHFVLGYGRSLKVRAKIDARLLGSSPGVDPLAKVFEGKRTFLNDLILPSNPTVNGKTFVDCEIVGPANIFLQVGNAINDVAYSNIDGVVLDGVTPFNNGFIFRNCAFRGCTFHRVTLFFTPTEASANAHVEWVNWITPMPAQQSLALDSPKEIEGPTSQKTKSTARKAQQ